MNLSEPDKNILFKNFHLLIILFVLMCKKFIEEYYTKFTDDIIWLKLKQHDASDNREKFIRIVLNNLSELFVRVQRI
jgi:hypothetical protein